MEWSLVERGSNAAEASRTFVLATEPELTDGPRVEVTLAGTVKIQNGAIDGCADPSPLYVVRVECGWPRQGADVPSMTWAAVHVLRQDAGEWLLDRTFHECDGVRSEPPDRVRRALGLDRHRDTVEALLRRAESVQLNAYAHADSNIRATAEPHARITTLAEIALGGWNIKVPHTTRGRQPQIAPGTGSKTARQRQRRIRPRTIDSQDW